MKKYHITIKLAIILDFIIILEMIARKYDPVFLFALLGTMSSLLPAVLGMVALCLSIIGQRERNPRLGIVLMIINILFSLGLDILALNPLASMVREFYISIPIMILFFAMQFFLCGKTESMKIRATPVYIIAFVSVIAGWAAIMVGILTGDDQDPFALSADLSSLIVIPGLIGVATAWVVYRIDKKTTVHWEIKQYHMTTKVALVLDFIIILCLIAEYIGQKDLTNTTWVGANEIVPLQISAMIGIVAIVLYTIGQVKLSAKLGIVMIIANVIFLLWLLQYLFIHFMVISM